MCRQVVWFFMVATILIKKGLGEQWAQQSNCYEKGAGKDNYHINTIQLGRYINYYADV